MNRFLIHTKILIFLNHKIAKGNVLLKIKIPKKANLTYLMSMRQLEIIVLVFYYNKDTFKILKYLELNVMQI